MNRKHKYWFRPIRFWKWFAFYVPNNFFGWAATFATVVFLTTLFLMIDRMSHSASDTFTAFAPWFAAILIPYDFLCLYLGEYPSWWRKRRKNFLV